jgi:hypothetical protein
MYIGKFDAADRQLASLEMMPFCIRNFWLNRVTAEEAGWLAQRMDRECQRLERHVGVGGEHGRRPWRKRDVPRARFR